MREERGNRWVIAAFGVIGLLTGYLPAYTDRISFWTIDGDAVRWLGVVLFAAGGALRLWPVYRARPSVQRPGRHPARTHAGHHRHLRYHSPPELFRIAGQLRSGKALAFRSGVGVLLTALLFIPHHRAHPQRKKACCARNLAREYDAYRARTSRLIPGLYLGV